MRKSDTVSANTKIPQQYRNKTFSDYKTASIVTQEFLKSNRSVIFGDVPTLLEVDGKSYRMGG